MGQSFVMKPIKTILSGILMLMLILPAVQQEFTWLKEPPLRGAFLPIDKPGFDELSWARWLSGEFQDEFNKRIEHHIGFRSTLVRLNNQLHYSFFRKANAEGVIVGQNGELFEEDYIRAYLGEFFIGETVWERKAAQLKKVQDTLAKLGKTIAVVFEPGKGSYHSDRFPNKYRNSSKKTSNYDYFSNQLKQQQVNVLDLNAYFTEKKENAAYPLFPKTGTHWSYYGAVRAADTMLSHLRSLHGPNIPEFKIKGFNLDSLRHPDDDIWLAMNMLFEPPKQGLAYPRLNFINTQMPCKYNLLAIGDSFFFNWMSDSIIYHMFNQADFWYYNKHMWNKAGAQTGLTSEVDLGSVVKDKDIILILITERFHQNFAWSFDEQLFDFFFPGPRDHALYFANSILTYNDEFMRLVADAKRLGMSLEERINHEAEYLMYLDSRVNPEKYSSRDDRIRIVMMGIRGTPDWYAKVVEKAKQANIPVEEMLRLDAEWVVDNQ
jgi:hypothetical protein